MFSNKDSEIEQLKNQYEEKHAEIENIRSNHDMNYKGQFEEKHREVESLNNIIHMKTTEYDNICAGLSNELDQFKHMHQEKEAELVNAISVITNKDNELLHFKNQFEEKHREVENLNTILSEKHAEIENIRSGFSNEIEQLKIILMGKDAELNHLKNQQNQ
jgi:molecular chaperone GrpE (heat shock protein)